MGLCIQMMLELLRIKTNTIKMCEKYHAEAFADGKECWFVHYIALHYYSGNLLSVITILTCINLFRVVYKNAVFYGMPYINWVLHSV